MREFVVGSDKCGALGGSGGVGGFLPGCWLTMADSKPRYRRGSWAEQVTFCADGPGLIAAAACPGGYVAPPSRRRGVGGRLGTGRGWVRAARTAAAAQRALAPFGGKSVAARLSPHNGLVLPMTGGRRARRDIASPCSTDPLGSLHDPPHHPFRSRGHRAGCDADGGHGV